MKTESSLFVPRSQADTTRSNAKPERDQFVDTLRAIATIAVVCGHSLVIGFWRTDGSIGGGNLLETVPGFRLLTWLFQVVPLFFVLSGYANAAAWETGSRCRADGSAWITSRLRPIALALAVPMLVGAMVAAVGRFFDAEAIVGRALWLSSIQIWFLAVFVIVTVLSPIGLRSSASLRLQLGALLAAALAVDMVRFMVWEAVAPMNFVFVWMACHQFGVAWRRGELAGSTRRQAVRALIVCATMVLLVAGPYSLSLVHIGGRARSNNYPPTVLLALIAMGQVFGALALRTRIERVASGRLGAVLARVNANGMTIYLWHLAAISLAGVASLYVPRLQQIPGSLAWWATRPLAFVLLFLCLGPIVMLAGRGERRMLMNAATKSRSVAVERPHAVDRTRPGRAAARASVAAAATLAATIQLCNWGMADASAPMGVRWFALSALAVALLASRPRRR